MATYKGLTWIEIIENAEALLKRNELVPNRSVLARLVNEAAQNVAIDTKEPISTYTVAWPSNNQIDLNANDILHPVNVYGDGATPLIYIPYDQYREAFLGSESGKPSIDIKNYWSVYNRILYLEPSVTGFTNAVVDFIPFIEKYAVAQNNNEPDIPFQFRPLISIELARLSAPARLEQYFDGMYRKQRARSENQLTNKNPSVTHFIDWFE